MWSVLVKACLLLAVTATVDCQYADFFQSFNAFLQPFTTVRPRHDVTKHKQTNKHKYEDIIYFENDRDTHGHIINNYSTKKSPKSSHTTAKPKQKPINSNIIASTINNHVARSIGSNNDNTYDNKDKNTFSIEYNHNRDSTGHQETGHQARGHQETGRQETGHQAKSYQSTFSNGYYQSNTQTTLNPLLNRPGVKPAVVDENLPPITNKPVTQSIYDLPFENHRPANTRPPYEIERPYIPANTRPPFEERPIVSNPVTYRPVVSKPVTSRPVISKPVTSRPVISKPVTSRPVISKPVTSRPVFSKPVEEDEPDIEIGPDEDEMSEVEKRRYYDMCEKKCSEFKSLYKRRVVALPLAGEPQLAEINVTSCPRHNVPLIIGGVVADIKVFPHMALVGWRKLQSPGYSWKCGASLVSEQHLLTAGHCTYYDKDDQTASGPPHAVQLGSSFVDGSDGLVVAVAAVIRHPRYKLHRSYHDVAVIRLTQTVSFSEKIRPACLGVPPPVGDSIIATGWGRTEFGDVSVELRSVSLPIWDMGSCREVWGTSRKQPQGPDPTNQLCAGEKKGAKDTCQGDSGGPAQIQDGCSWRLVAVTSVGRSCGAPETPALYAKIPRAFIASQIYTNAKTNTDQYVWGSETSTGGHRGSGDNSQGNRNNQWGSVNDQQGNKNNQWGSGNNRGSNNQGGTVNNHQGSGTNQWGSVNNQQGNENNQWGNSNNQRGTSGSTSNWNSGVGSQNGRGGENQGSNFDQRGSSTNGGTNWGGNSGSAINKANAGSGNHRGSSSAISNDRENTWGNTNRGSNYATVKPVQKITNPTTVYVQNNPINFGGYEQIGGNNYFKGSTDYNRNDNIYNYPVNSPWWVR